MGAWGDKCKGTWKVSLSGGGLTCEDSKVVTVVNNGYDLSAGTYGYVCESYTTLNATSYSVGQGVWTIESIGSGGSASLENSTAYNSKLTISPGATVNLKWHYDKNGCPKDAFATVVSKRVVANAKDLTDWINTVHSDTYLVNTDFRPVPLRHYFYSDETQNEILPLFEPGGSINRKIKTGKSKSRFQNKKRGKISPIRLVDILNQKDMLPAIYFTFSRKKCDMYMEDCADLNLLDKDEEKEIRTIIDEYIQDNPYLLKHKNIKSIAIKI